MSSIKFSQNSVLPEPVPGQRLILDSEQYNLSTENDNGFFSSTTFYIIVAVLLLGIVGYFGWKFIRTSK